MDTARLINLSAAAVLAVASVGCESFPKDLANLVGGDSSALDDGTIADGLREALRVGTERAVDDVSGTDGFLDNDLIRIPLPEQVESMASALRKIGLGSQVDDIETSMNRAAEMAAAEATPIFWDAVTNLTIDDARAVLDGGKHSATKLLRKRTAPTLQDRFRPIVTAKMKEIGLSQLYGELADRYDSLPFAQDPAVRLEDYVTEKTVDGVFKVLAQEEERIRDDPVARTSEILQRVFR
jgi:hypothetical protein